MIVRFNPGALKQVAWHEYLIRFSLGGLVTAIAGVLAAKCGPNFGGLFLAFPAILAASASLVDKHERKRKQSQGLHGATRGKSAAAADATCAAIGSFGLMTFAACVWKLLPEHSTAAVLAIATAGWAMVSGALWWLWRRGRKTREFTHHAVSRL